MPRTLTFFAIAPLTLALAACNGAVGSSAAFNPTPPVRDAVSRAAIAELSSEIFDGVRDEVATPKNEVPLGGSATYEGTVQMDIVTPRTSADVAGLIEMDVNFGTDRVSGQMGNFVESDGQNIAGALALRNGRLSRTSNSREVALFSDFGGRLTGPGGERIDVDGDISGGFAGRNVQYIGADLDGRVVVDGLSGSLDGLTALER